MAGPASETASDRFHKYKNALSEEQVQDFFLKGYVVVKKIFSKKEISRMKDDIEKGFDEALIIARKTLVEKSGLDKEFRCEFEGSDCNSASILAVHNDDDTLSIKLISWIGGVKPNLITFGRDERITVKVAQLLGSNKGDHLINQAHYKKPRDQVAFDWHQDIQNRRSFDPNWNDINGKGSFVQVLTAIDDVYETNGPLVIVPNSHNLDLELDKIEKIHYEEEIKKEYPDLEKITLPVLLEAGDTIFMHPLILHKSDPNNSDLAREMFINGFSYPGANKKPYPGRGSAKEINFNASEDLLHVTQNFVSEILGKAGN